jgi:hypothetical protein
MIKTCIEYYCKRALLILEVSPSKREVNKAFLVLSILYFFSLFNFHVILGVYLLGILFVLG